MKKPNWEKLIALMLMDIMRSEEEDELVGKVDIDLPYEYQMDRVKVVGSSPHNDTLEKE